MSSFLNIFGGSEDNTESDTVAETDNILLDNVEDMGNPIGSVIETGTKWAKEHPVFILWGVVAIAGLVYLAYFRNTDPEETAVEQSLLGKNTEELMDDLKLDLNLTKNVKGEHLSVSSDDEDESEASKENELEHERINELSNDLNELEEYTQESSMDI